MARAGDLEVRIETLAQGGSVVRVEGELDIATTQHLEAAVEDTEPQSRLVIDLTACTFLDSSAIRVLLSKARSAQATGGSISLVASDPGLLRVLEIASVGTVLPVHPTLDAAL